MKTSGNGLDLTPHSNTKLWWLTNYAKYFEGTPEMIYCFICLQTQRVIFVLGVACYALLRSAENKLKIG